MKVFHFITHHLKKREEEWTRGDSDCCYLPSCKYMIKLCPKFSWRNSWVDKFSHGLKSVYGNRARSWQGLEFEPFWSWIWSWRWWWWWWWTGDDGDTWWCQREAAHSLFGLGLERISFTIPTSFQGFEVLHGSIWTPPTPVPFFDPIIPGQHQFFIQFIFLF